MQGLRKSEVLERVFLVECDRRDELASTFLRFQEHYESPRFRGSVFTREQFVAWHVAERGAFTYGQDWSGFNVPSWALEPFYQGLFDPLEERELRLLELFRGESEPYYVIGVVGDGTAVDRWTLEHELAHGLFATSAAYRRAVRACLQGEDIAALERELLSKDYCPQVLQDEVHAYLLTEPFCTRAERHRLAPLRRRLRAVFNAHGGTEAVRRVVHRAA